MARVKDPPEVVALRELATRLALEGSPMLPAVERQKRWLLLFEQDTDALADAALTVRAIDGQFRWGDPERAHNFDEAAEAAKEITYYLASDGS